MEISTLGNRRVPSFYDYVLVNRMCAINFPRNFCKEGGFRHPRECARCICPRGFGGPDCGKRDNAHKCGSDLTAVSQWRELEIKMKASPENEPTCHWIIKAPHSKKVQVQFVKLDAKCDYKCSRSLEIKIRADFALSGHRVCCLTLSQGHEWKSETQRAVVSAFAPDPLTVTIMYRTV
ncbi:hypothetical protein L596_010665 [Steinernema carpocapsae]|uniref:CUB domain-containing protein n=1 Tax=Steinernema carpocapsae TaxID=34508 RepID=A0A4U5PJ07_STECR|nr:hypothetical protein L596_010665 [Steinernema carpocapsae]